MAEAKKRAPRNRTLSVREDEKEALSRGLRRRVAGEGIFCGDAFTLLPRLKPLTIDLLFADPPYNLNRRFGSEHFRERSGGEYQVWLRSWLELCMPLLKPTASVYICGDWRSSAAIQTVGSEFFKLRNRITWEREKGRGAKANWKNAAEDIWFFTASDKYTFNLDVVKQRRRVVAPYRENGRAKDWDEKGKYRDTHPSNIWTDLTVPFWSMPENTDHPTQKPEKLLAKLILASTDPGDLVLDPFAGSGTTAVVAKKLGRRFVTIETDEDHCFLAQKRLLQAKKGGPIQGFADGVFWERNSGPSK